MNASDAAQRDADYFSLMGEERTPFPELTEKPPTLFDKKPVVSDEEYEAFMGEPRPEPESAGE